MKKLVMLLTSCLVGAPVFAQVLTVGNPTYDPFADATGTPPGTGYVPGDNLAGQISASFAVYDNSIQSTKPQWVRRTGPGSSGTQPTLVAGDLSYAGLYSAGGGRSAAFGPDGDSALMDLAIGSGGITPGSYATVYWSYVLKLTDLTGLSTNGVGLLGATRSEQQPPESRHQLGGSRSPGGRMQIALQRFPGASPREEHKGTGQQELVVLGRRFKGPVQPRQRDPVAAHACECPGFILDRSRSVSVHGTRDDRGPGHASSVQLAGAKSSPISSGTPMRAIAFLPAKISSSRRLKFAGLNNGVSNRQQR